MFAYSSRIIADEPNNPIADPAASIVSGNARFTMLTPGLVRLEWSPDGKFEDRASQVFINRRLSVPKFTRGDRQGFLTIKTDKIEIRYKEGAGKFDKKNLAVMLKTGPNDTTWELAPPFENTANLGGTKRTLDEVSGSCPLEPGLLSQNGWTFIDDSQRLLFDGSDWPWAVPREKKAAVDWYFFVYGHDYKGALAEFIKVAGRIPLPPRFAFGAWWSRYWAYSADELKQLVKEFREHDVPLDVLVVDMDWHLDGWTGYTWNPKYFPDPDGFLKWVHEQGLKVALNLHPAEGVGKQEKQFPEMCKAMGLDPKKTERIPFDCTDRRFVDAYFNVLHRPLEKAGIDFWWIDWQQGLKTKIEGLDPLWWLNYLHWTDMERRAAETGRRPLLFSRWGGLGNHRYQIGFSGDTFSNWQSLAFQPHFTATAGNVGYGYWSHDIGGHQPGKVDPELYVRWLQWGALSPIFRTHTTKNAEAERRIWMLPTEYFEAGRKAYQLRYQLIPYIYTAARQCYDTGVPICRPLYLDWAEEAEAYKHDGEYMFGDQLLVAPVTEPAEPVSGCAMVEVWLPPGKWTNWFSGRTYDGGKTIPLVVPLDEIPIFAKSGGVVPISYDSPKSSHVPGDHLAIRVFPGESGEYRLYEDDATSSRYMGSGAWTPISVQSQENKQIITIGAVKGLFAGMASDRGLHVDLRESRRPSRVLVNGNLLRKAHGDDPGPAWESFFVDSPFTTSISPERKRPNEQMDIVVEFGEDANEEITAITSGATQRLSALSAISSYQYPLLGKAVIAHNDINNSSVSVKEWLIGAYERFADWPTYFAEIRDASISIEDKMRLISRLLGLFFRFNVQSDPNATGAFNVTALVEPTIPFDPNAFDATLNLKTAPGWSLMGAGTSARGPLVSGKPLVSAAKLVGDGTPHTAVVSASLTISAKDDNSSPITFDFQKVLMPSINVWQIVGPFDGPFEGALDRELPPEGTFDANASFKAENGETLKWRQLKREIKAGDDLTGEFFVDFDKVFGRRVKDCVVYGFTYLDSPDNMDAVLALGSSDGVAIWLNGREVHRHDGSRSYSSKSDRTPVHLKRGINELLVKIAQSGGGGGFCVHVEDGQGKPLTVVKARLTP